jgi:hypothetical protein
MPGNTFRTCFSPARPDSARNHLIQAAVDSRSVAAFALPCGDLLSASSPRVARTTGYRFVRAPTRRPPPSASACLRPQSAPGIAFPSHPTSPRLLQPSRKVGRRPGRRFLFVHRTDSEVSRILRRSCSNGGKTYQRVGLALFYRGFDSAFVSGRRRSTGKDPSSACARRDIAPSTTSTTPAGL